MPSQDFSAFSETELKKIHADKVRQLQSIQGWSKMIMLWEEIRSIEQAIAYKGPKCLSFTNGSEQ